MIKGSIVAPYHFFDGKIMREKSHKSALFYAPRLLSVVLLVILTFFAVDAYQSAESTTFGNSPFAIYLFPVFVLLIITAISWKKARFGGTLFIIGGFFYAFMVDEFSVSSLAMVATPLILLGVLFHVSQYFYEK